MHLGSQRCALLSAAVNKWPQNKIDWALLPDSSPPLPAPRHTCLRIKDLKVKGIRSNIQPFKENGFLEVKSLNLPFSSPPQRFLIRHLVSTGSVVITTMEEIRLSVLGQSWRWHGLSSYNDWKITGESIATVCGQTDCGKGKQTRLEVCKIWAKVIL